MKDDILNRIIEWAKKEKDIRAVILIGSLAGKRRIDELSDIDLSIFARKHQKYANDDRWMSTMGTVWVYEPEKVYFKNREYPTRLVIFKDGIKIDFAFYSLDVLKDLTSVKRLPFDYDLAYRILVDKDGQAKTLRKPSYRQPKTKQPTGLEFKRTVEVFFFEAYHVAKFLSRNDLWHAKFRDWSTKEHLLQMIEWYEKSKHGWDYDTHDLGKRMASWVSPSTLKSLEGVFAHFDAKDGWKALLSTMNLFAKLARRTAASLGFTYPRDLDLKMTAFVQRLRRVNE